MLIQSHEGFLDFLPALPASWTDGKVSKLVARGGFEVNLKWENGKLSLAEVISKKGENCRIKIPAGGKLKISCLKGTVGHKKISQEMIEFKTRPGEKYKLFF